MTKVLMTVNIYPDDAIVYAKFMKETDLKQPFVFDPLHIEYYTPCLMHSEKLGHYKGTQFQVAGYTVNSFMPFDKFSEELQGLITQYNNSNRNSNLEKV